MQDEINGSVIVISSHVMRGSVGNRAAVFGLEALGFPVWAVPTIVMPWHPGQGPSTRLRFDNGDFDKAMQDLAVSRWTGEVRAILTGYFGSADQVWSAAQLIRTMKAANPDLVYVCDPVMGDRGGLYVPVETAQAIRDELIPLASVSTPNRYELAWMTGAELETNTDIMKAALALGPPKMLITSAVPMMAGGIGNLCVTGRHALLAEHRAFENVPNGLGDLLSALFLARLLQGMGDEKALQSATASVFEVVARTVRRGLNELSLETDASSLSTPMAMIQMRNLLHPARSKGK